MRGSFCGNVSPVFGHFRDIEWLNAHFEAFCGKPEIRIRGRQALEGLLEGVSCECEGISPRIRTSPLLQAPVEGALRKCECRVLAFQLIFDAQYGKMRRRFILCGAELPGRGRSWRKKLKKLSPGGAAGGSGEGPPRFAEDNFAECSSLRSVAARDRLF